MAGVCCARVPAMRSIRAGAKAARAGLARAVQRPCPVAVRPTRFAIRSLATPVAVPAASTPRWRRSAWDTHLRSSSSRFASTSARAASATDEAPAIGDLAASPPAASGTETPETMLFLVEGMRCGGCSAAVSKVLNADPGVARAAVNLVTETAAVELAPGVDALETIARAKSAELALARALPRRRGLQRRVRAGYHKRWRRGVRAIGARGRIGVGSCRWRYS